MTFYKYTFVVILFLFWGHASFAQNNYRLWLFDKSNWQSEACLMTNKAIGRRKKNKVQLGWEDQEISKGDLFKIHQNTQLSIITFSKWLNYIVVESELSTNELVQLDYVKHVDLIYEDINKSQKRTSKLLTKRIPKKSAADVQNEILQLNSVLSEGLSGKGVTIAIMDAGFYGVNTAASLFHQNSILDTFNMWKDQPFYAVSSQHGTKVFSLLAADHPELKGVSSAANFYLFRTEHTSFERPLEMDYWIRAAEMADSIGVDIIQTSLGYNTFDDEQFNFTHNDLNGESVMSKASSIAASHGIVVVTSAGNSGDSSWEKITIPGDAKNILTVGAVSEDLEKVGFSSFGIENYVVKPEVMALGAQVAVVNANNQIEYSNGTSFSSPQIAGVAALLIEKFPFATSNKIREIIIQSSDQYQVPDLEKGYGIVNVEKASKLLTKELFEEQKSINLIQDKAGNTWVISDPKIDLNWNLKISSLNGQVLKSIDLILEFERQDISSYLNDVPTGLYFFQFNSRDEVHRIKSIWINPN